MKIAVSAGHDPMRRGACYEGICEHDLTVPWQSAILSHLGSAGVKVPPNLNLSKKIQWINSQPGIDIVMELHFNAGSVTASGCETLYAPGSRKGMLVAETVQGAISSFCAPNRGIKEGWYRMDRPGHVDYRGDVEGDEVVDAFLRSTYPPAIIVEPFFMREQSRIDALRETVCQVIAEALLESAVLI